MSIEPNHPALEVEAEVDGIENEGFDVREGGRWEAMVLAGVVRDGSVLPLGALDDHVREKREEKVDRRVRDESVGFEDVDGSTVGLGLIVIARIRGLWVVAVDAEVEVEVPAVAADRTTGSGAL